MAKKERILFDKTEIVAVVVNGKSVQVLNLTYDKIVSIQFDKAVARGLFGSKPSEKITITVRGREAPVVYLKHKEGDFFEGYKAGLAKFAKDNKISFHDGL